MQRYDKNTKQPNNSTQSLYQSFGMTTTIHFWLPTRASYLF